MSRRTKPHMVRDREVEEEYGADPDGRPVLRHRVVDTLGKMLRAGTITLEQHHAARNFQATFAAAGLDPLRARPLDTVAGSGGHGPQPTEWQALARRRDRD